MTYPRPDLQPTPLVPHDPKEPARHQIANPNHDAEDTALGKADAFRQDAEGRGEDEEGDEDLEEEEGALGEGVEDGEEAVDGVEGEGGDAGDVAGGEEGGLQEEEGEEGDAEVGEGEGAVVIGFGGGWFVQRCRGGVRDCVAVCAWRCDALGWGRGE